MRLFFGSAVMTTALTALAAAAGLVSDTIYRDNALVRAGWWGNDMVTLFLAVPLLAATIGMARQGSRRGLLVCIGLLAYAAYNYAFYLFGAAFNDLFLVYVGILSFATLGLIGGLSSSQLQAQAQRIPMQRSDRVIGSLIVGVASFLGLFWISTSVTFLFTGEVPAMVTATAHPTNVTGALDLWLVVTFGLLGGSWLLREWKWGFIISAVWTVKGALYMTALSAASISAFARGASDSLIQLGLWIPIGAVCLVGTFVLLRPGGPSEALT